MLSNRKQCDIVAAAYRTISENVDPDDPSFRELMQQEIEEETRRVEVSQQSDLSIYFPEADQPMTTDNEVDQSTNETENEEIE